MCFSFSWHKKGRTSFYLFKCLFYPLSTYCNRFAFITLLLNFFVLMSVFFPFTPISASPLPWVYWSRGLIHNAVSYTEEIEYLIDLRRLITPLWENALCPCHAGLQSLTRKHYRFQNNCRTGPRSWRLPISLSFSSLARISLNYRGFFNIFFFWFFVVFFN